MCLSLQGVLGGRCSGKSALVHRHLTGSYLQLENTEGWCLWLWNDTCTLEGIYPQEGGEKKTVCDNAGVFAGRQYFKDVLVDGQSHLLIIREETELPGAQVRWETS